MRIITTRELRNRTKAVFEMAEKERVAIKRGDKFWELTESDDPTISPIDGDWIREFLAIPEEFRVNPFDISPSGDIYWADKRNVDGLNRAIKQHEEDTAKGVKYPTWDEFKKTLDI